jgi:pyruvate dehydrogenase E2 component (dihydrolipoamide acetyltransferase)
MKQNLTPILMPKWGLTMEEGQVIDWLVEEGTEIEVGDEIIEVETDKIAGVVEAPDAGLLRRCIAETDTIYPVKSLLGVLADSSVLDAEIETFIEAYEIPDSGEEDAEESGPQYLYTEVDGLRVRYADRGSGDSVVLLLHGFGGDLDNWLFNLDALADKHRVLALDLPGHGESEKTIPEPSISGLAKFVGEFLEVVGVPSAHIVGHSMGGAIAMQMVTEHPESVDSLGLICSSGLGPEINSDYLQGFVDAQSRRELKPVLQQLFADESLVNRKLVDDVLKYKRLDGVDAVLRTLSATLLSGTQTILSDKIIDSGKPILVIWGEKDCIIPVAYAQKLADSGNSSVEVEIFDSAGHMVQMEKANDVNRRLLKFFG